MGSRTYQSHRPRFCSICRLFQEMERGNDIEEADLQIYFWHLQVEHGVTLKAAEEVLTR